MSEIKLMSNASNDKEIPGHSPVAGGNAKYFFEVNS
jgi:hypothetical protein